MMPTADDDIRKAIGVDRHRGFALFVDAYQAMVYRIAVRYLGIREDAEDAVQEIFLKAYRGIVSFNERSKLSTWLYRIAVNHCIDRIRRRKRVQWEPLADTAADDAGIRRVENDTGEMIHRALHMLSEKHRTILILKELDEMSYEQIASILHIRIGTVESRLFYARKRLREVLGEHRQGVSS